MLFNSLEFLVFLPVVFLLYWFVLNKHLRMQNLFLIAVSYLFYGWWDWRFLSLIFISSLADYFTGIWIHKSNTKSGKQLFLGLSILVNLGFLGYFKYAGFFSESLAAAFASIGIQLDSITLDIILPVGISFYTFQTLSYSIDIYRGQFKPQRDIIAFFAFVSFFPQLVAGPIERAKTFLPQFLNARNFDYQNARDGVRQIIWGFFKKVVLADNAGKAVEYIFNNYETMDSFVLIIGLYLFAFQLYGDFSGYSDIAIGTARLFGFNLMKNFDFPFLSRSVPEFWRRWHISLTSWFRDYVYFPLGGSYHGMFRRNLNIVLTMAICGLWHGADWTFIFWGLANGLYFIPFILLNYRKEKTRIVAENRFLPGIREVLLINFTLFLKFLPLGFFRSPDLSNAFNYYSRMFSFEFSGSIVKLFETESLNFGFSLIAIAFVYIVEYFQRFKHHGLEIKKFPLLLRWLIYILLTLFVIHFLGDEQQFIYFQF